MKYILRILSGALILIDQETETGPSLGCINHSNNYCKNPSERVKSANDMFELEYKVRLWIYPSDTHTTYVKLICS